MQEPLASVIRVLSSYWIEPGANFKVGWEGWIRLSAVRGVAVQTKNFFWSRRQLEIFDGEIMQSQKDEN